MSDRTILTAEEMRAAEALAIAGGTPVETLMERAGAAAAEAIWRFAGPQPTLVLCGPGNNGGDGYVIARALAGRGSPVRVAALSDPTTPAARVARAAWTGEVGPIATATAAPLLVDALFGTGLSRGLDEAAAGRLGQLAGEARTLVAIDLPSGVATDDGALLSPVPAFDMTVTFQTLKPAHLLQPAARFMGRLVVADIGLVAESRLVSPGRPRLSPPGPEDHKYKRGYAAFLAGEMPGASALGAGAALRAGAGYVRLFAPEPVANVPAAVVQAPGSAFSPDARIGALVAGPGLGRGVDARKRLDAAIASGLPLVLDADALTLMADQPVPAFDRPVLMTPHAGEFERLFGDIPGSKVDKARAAARRSGAVILLKGADSVVAAPDGRAALSAFAPSWLASAGTGDVLAGVAAARLAATGDPFLAACQALWLHGRAAQIAGPGLIADDLLPALALALAQCR